MHEALMFVLFSIAAFVIGALAVIVVIWMATNKIDLKYLIADEAGDASMTRFQLLLFTFIVAVGLVKALAAKDGFPEIPNSILVLIGVSGSTYAVGKAVNSSPVEEASAGTTNPPPPSTGTKHP